MIFLYFCFSIAAPFIFKTLFCITDVIWPQSWTNGCELFFGSPFSPLFIVEMSVMRAKKLACALFIFFSHSLTLNIGAKGKEKSLLTFCPRLLMILPFWHFVSLLFIGSQRDNKRKLIAEKGAGNFMTVGAYLPDGSKLISITWNYVSLVVN